MLFCQFLLKFKFLHWLAAGVQKQSRNGFVSIDFMIMQQQKNNDSTLLFVVLRAFTDNRRRLNLFEATGN